MYFLKKSFKSFTILSFLKLICILCNGSMDSAVVRRECIYELLVNKERFFSNLSFFSFWDFPSQDAKGWFSTIRKAFTNEALEIILD